MNIEVSNGDRIVIGDVYLDVTIKHEEALWDKDIQGELATNANPTNPSVWWKRRLDQIDVVTIHHTLSDSPHVTFKNYLSKRRPTGPYTFWISQTGTVYLCVDPKLGVYHDHTGFYVKQDGRTLWGNSHLSVGMAGRLHEYIPADVQLERTAKFVADIIRGDMFPAIGSINCIKGHMDIGTYKDRTQCPGWWVVKNGRQVPSGDRWKMRFYNMIREELKHA